MLEVKNLNTYYDNVQILWDVSLQIGEGEIVALLGANGAGKTTLLNSLTGLVRPAASSVAFLGQEITNLPTNEIVELGIAYLPEGETLPRYDGAGKPGTGQLPEKFLEDKE